MRSHGSVLLAACVALAGCGDDSAGIDAGDGTLTDELSMPGDPTLSLDSFNSAEECGACHKTHFAEWKSSNHAYSMVDPVFRALVAKRQEAFDGAQDRFCLQCHTAIGTRSGDIQPGFSFDDLAPITLEGITCESCHKVSGLARGYNSGHIFDPDGPIRGPIADPVENGFHESEYSPLHDTSDFCGGCHDIVEVSGLNLERPFAEWLESPAAADGQNCQSCHMPTYDGEATTGSPTRKLHRHRWIGVDVPLRDGFLSQDEAELIRDGVVELLDGAATVQLEAESVAAGNQIDLYVAVKNNIPAHNFPTGSTFLRQAWVEVTARDADENIIYQTGHLDENGDLRNFFSELDPFGDPDLLLLSSGFINSDGVPVVYSWEASEHVSGSLSPNYTRTSTLFIPTKPGTKGPVTVDAKIRFRAFAPYLLRTLELDNYLEKLESYDVDDASLSIPLAPPE